MKDRCTIIKNTAVFRAQHLKANSQFSKQGIRMCREKTTDKEVIILLLVVAISIIGINSISSLEKNEIGFNSKTYGENYDDLADSFFEEKFNIVQIFEVGGKKVLWVPWYTSSSECTLDKLHNMKIPNPDWEHNTMVSDEFSELGIVLSMASNQTRFDYWVNTLEEIKSPYGKIPVWIASRNGNKIILESYDSASDGTARIGLALYFASRNENFAEERRNYYKDLADEISYNHVQFEMKSECLDTSQGEICNWFAGGRNAAQNFASDPFVWVGYFPDAIKLMQAAYVSTGDEKFKDISEDYVKQFLIAVKYSGGTNKENFKTAPFSWRWDMSSGEPNIYSGNTYHFESSNSQWDVSDAPRALWMCDTLRTGNLSFGGIYGIYNELLKYCNAWEKADIYEDKSCIQYKYDGSCATSFRKGYYENGLGAGIHTLTNPEKAEIKVRESLTHFDWNKKVYDGAQCPGIYRAVRPVKALGFTMGNDEDIFIKSNESAEENLEYDSVISNLMKLKSHCEIEEGCEKILDLTENGCRETEYNTSRGEILVSACEVEDDFVEINRKKFPENITFKVCVGDSCVNKYSDVVRFRIDWSQFKDPKMANESVYEETIGSGERDDSLFGSVTNRSETNLTDERIPLKELKININLSGESYKKSDLVSGTCREVSFSTIKGDLKAKICEKENSTYEMYRILAPENFNFEICVENGGCITKDKGFSKFMLAGTNFVEEVTEIPIVEKTGLESEATCNIQGSYCQKIKDVISGTCRTIEFETEKGIIIISACDKGDKIELYRQTYPAETQFSVCLGETCIDEYRGFNLSFLNWLLLSVR